MSDFLDNMAASSAERAALLPGTLSSVQLDKPVFPLRLSSFDVIAEIKDRSPSEGALASANTGRVDQAAAYTQGGAAAISVLTEPARFAGDISHLEEVVNAVSGSEVPVMRKDFLVSTGQVLEAKAAGASGVLLIAAMLSDDTLEDMLSCAYEHSLFVLLEAFDEEDLRRTRQLLENARHQSQAEVHMLIVGVNTRNLRTLEVDSQRLAKLSPLLPGNATCVAESGLLVATDAANSVDLGYKMALIGTALMRSEHPAGLLAEMLDAGRQRAQESA
jgi:indole-3-glycerol phosphate synthase